VGFLDYVTVGDDVSLGIDDHAGVKRALADIAAVRSTLPAEEAVKEILKRIIVTRLRIVIGSLRRNRCCTAAASTAGRARRSAAVRILNGGFGVDVNNRRLELFSDLREGGRKLFRSRDSERRCVAGGVVLILTAHT